MQFSQRDSQVNAAFVALAVEDPHGNTTQVNVYHYLFTLDASMDETDVIFPLGAALAIREPNYRHPMEGGIPVIRIDSPSDLVFLDRQSEFVNDVSWPTATVVDAPQYPTAALGWKDRGNEYYKRKQWFCAAIAFSQGLKLEPRHHLLLLNRAAAYLELGCFNSAAADAEAVVSMDIREDAHRRKAVYRAVKANYRAERYREVRQFAGLYPHDLEIQHFTTLSGKRLSERAHARYDWPAMYDGSRTPGSRPDVTYYSLGVEIRLPEGETTCGCQAGLFTRHDVKAGDLLVCHWLRLL